jgi:hypothetical protein
MPGDRRRVSSRCRPALFWCAGCFLLFQLGLDLLLERWQPIVRDPEYGYKLQRLRKQVADHPRRPLVLVLGSSRTNLGVCPEAMHFHGADPDTIPLVFNFSINGAGPELELMTLRRLLADGFRPAHVVLEVLPPLLHQDESYNEELMLNINRLGVQDLRSLLPFSSHPQLLSRRWLRSRMLPCITFRHWLVMHYAHSLIHIDPERPQDWRNLDRLGWEVYPRQHVDADEYARGFRFAADEYAEPLRRFEVTPRADRMVRAVIDLCRREGIAVSLLLMAEGSDFRALYSKAARVSVRDYTARLCREYAIGVIDAREWMPDDAFFDGHHLLPGSAAVFSMRLAAMLENVMRNPKSEARNPKQIQNLKSPNRFPKTVWCLGF